jgi:3-methyl-2-oxobutanoate hydroxymethyltransferase
MPRVTRVTPDQIRQMKARGERIPMLTAYDYPTAHILDEAGVPLLLVGDTLGMIILGYDSTLPVTVDDIIHHARAVVRGTKRALVVADMPFGSFQVSPEETVRAAIHIMKEAGPQAVKLEGGVRVAESVRLLTEAGIPVMGHVGLTPQTATALGGYRAQGRTAERARRVADEALALERAGCFALVFEAIPAAVAEALMPRLVIPVIGIGAGAATDGQVLVLHDLLGVYDRTPRFVKRYANLREQMLDALRDYTDDVRGRRFPSAEHTYSIDPGELQALRESLDD